MTPSNQPADLTPADQILRVGDRVWWRGGFGHDAPQLARVRSLEVTPGSGMKYGEAADRVRWVDHFVADLDNGHWAYSTQLAPVAEVPLTPTSDPASIVGRVQRGEPTGEAEALREYRERKGLLNDDGSIRCERCDGDGEGDHGPCPDCDGEGAFASQDVAGAEDNAGVHSDAEGGL